MQLTQKHFDTVMSGVLEKVTKIDERLILVEKKMVTKEELTKVESKLIGRIDSIEAKMVTKNDLKVALDAQTVELQDYVHQSFETQQDYMDERFGELIEKYDVRERVGILEKDVAILKASK